VPIPPSDAPSASEPNDSWQSPFRLLLLFALALPGLLFGAVAWQERNTLLREAEQTAKRTAAALTEHALKVLETHALVLEQVDAQVRDRSWEEIAADRALQRNLSALVGKLPQITTIQLVDETGQVRLSNVARAGTGMSIADRDYFAAHRDRADTGTFISRTFDGRTSGARQFTVSMRRTTSDGSFGGLIAVAVAIDYFTTFWKQFAPSIAYVIPLIRDDGQMLVRYPRSSHPDQLGLEAPFMREIQTAPTGYFVAASAIDGIERLHAYSRIGGYPLYVSFGMETRAVLAAWYQRLLLYASLGLLTTLALVALVLMAMRQAREQRRAAAGWQQAAQRYEAEIRRRKRAESELIQAQKMEAVGQLTGGVAHDFNNLLHAMGLNLRLAERSIGDGPAAQFLAGVRRGIDRATKLTQQLTAFSRRQRLEPCPFDPGELVVRMADLLQRTLGGTVELDLDTDRDVWPAFADPNQTELALLNLAVNARDAMPAGGKLIIRAVNARLDEPQAGVPVGEYVKLSVTDNGTGMPPEVIEHAFEPFFTTKEVGKGSGLGLSMVHGFATQSGGSVSIESRLGHGTTVSLLLPRAAVAAAVPEHTPDSGLDRSRLGGRILLTEDDSLVRASMLLALQDAGYTVEEARSGAEALEVLRRGPVDLLVTDYAMPGMSGVELARLARALQPRLPVILVTGYAQPALDARPPRHHVNAVLHKPFAPQELVARIEALLWATSEHDDRAPR
jgi:two-component system, NtrC family, sensor kinase